MKMDGDTWGVIFLQVWMDLLNPEKEKGEKEEGDICVGVANSLEKKTSSQRDYTKSFCPNIPLLMLIRSNRNIFLSF